MVSNNLQCLGIFKDFCDGTLKNVYQKPESEDIIEMTLVQNKSNMDVFCVPTHHFCSLGCKMCHLTATGLDKGMIPIKFPEFCEALYKTSFLNCAAASKHNNNNPKRRTNKENCLISFMGVGEPLLNLNLIKEVFLHEELIKNACHYNKIGYALSTIFPYKDISPLTSLVDIGMPLKVHFSLHSPFSEERFNLLPSTSVSVPEALELLCAYREYIMSKPSVMERFSQTHTVNDPVEIHYTLIKDVNDSNEHLNELISLLKKYPIQLKFILFNPIGNMKRSSHLDTWLYELRQLFPHINIVSYEPPGREIGSSCGEFTRHYYHEKIETKQQFDEFKQWESAHQISENEEFYE